MENLNLEEPVKSSEDTGSAETQDNSSTLESRKELIQFSNTSIMQGYNLAIDILLLNGYKEAGELLMKNSTLIEYNLKASVEDRLVGYE